MGMIYISVRYIWSIITLVFYFQVLKIKIKLISKRYEVCNKISLYKNSKIDFELYIELFEKCFESTIKIKILKKYY